MAEPTPPACLGTAGTALWTAVMADVPTNHELDSKEAHALHDAAAMADAVAALEEVVAREGVMSVGVGRQPVVHPALVEARMTRVALNRLLQSVGLEAAGTLSARSSRSQRAAQIRWARRDTVQAEAQ